MYIHITQSRAKTFGPSVLSNERWRRAASQILKRVLLWDPSGCYSLSWLGFVLRCLKSGVRPTEPSSCFCSVKLCLKRWTFCICLTQGYIHTIYMIFLPDYPFSTFTFFFLCTWQWGIAHSIVCQEMFQSHPHKEKTSATTLPHFSTYFPFLFISFAHFPFFCYSTDILNSLGGSWGAYWYASRETKKKEYGKIDKVRAVGWGSDLQSWHQSALFSLFAMGLIFTIFAPTSTPPAPNICSLLSHNPTVYFTV